MTMYKYLSEKVPSDCHYVLNKFGSYNKARNSKELENQIKLSLKALITNREIGLLYSGGIDSSVLFVLLNELCNFHPTHFLYEGVNSDDHRLIQRFNKFFNDRISIEAKQKSSIKDIINEMSQGFNKIVGAQYLNKRKTKG